MWIKCLHGYFMIEPETSGEISRFISLYGLELVPLNGYYTFPALLEAKKYSIKGNYYLGVIATETIEGHPWEVMRENKIVYDFNSGEARLLNATNQVPEVYIGENYYFSPGLLLPGSLRSDGKRVTDYTAKLIWESQKFRYTDIKYE